MAGIGVRESRQPGGQSGEQVRILLVGEQPSASAGVESELAASGWQIVRAASEDEALLHLRNQDFALVLLPARAPGAGQADLAALIHDNERSRHTPILLLETADPAILRPKMDAFISLGQQMQSLRRRNAELEERIRLKSLELEDSSGELLQFVHAISHDLQGPMRAIGSYTQLLQRRLTQNGDADVREFLGYIVEAVHRMSALLNDLLVYSQISEGKAELIEDVDCEAVLGVIRMNLAAAIGESGAVISHDPLPVVPYDFARLTEVFEHLVSNAIKFRRPGTAPGIHIAAVEQDDGWQFSVADNGMGIEPRSREQVFGVLKRLHGKEFPGTGMGLAIARKIIERHGGRIWVEAAPESGSIFYFTIPK